MSVKICLDAGHSGKRNQSPGVAEYYESEMAWKLHNYLKSELEGYGIDVITTRKDINTDLDVYNRGTASKGYTLFISLHSNAVSNSMNESVDYPVSYVMLNGKSTDIGLKIAKVVETVMGTKQQARTATRKGSRGEYYGVLRGANDVGTPGIIVEHSFHTNTKAAEWLLDDNNLKTLAKAEADCIAKFYGLTKIENTSSAGNDNLYRVQVGAYKELSNASVMRDKLKAAGYDVYMVKTEGLYKIQIGAYSIKPNADSMCTKVRAAGFEAFITTVLGVVEKEANPYKEPSRTIKYVSGQATMMGEDVKWVQWELVQAGYEKVEIDGKFGPISSEALIEYQAQNGLEPDGKCGPATRECMINN